MCYGEKNRGKKECQAMGITVLNRMVKKDLTKKGHLNSDWRSGSKFCVFGRAAKNSKALRQIRP